MVRAGLFKNEREWILWAMREAGRHTTPKVPMRAMHPLVNVPNLKARIAPFVSALPEQSMTDTLQRFAMLRGQGAADSANTIGAQMDAAAAWLKLSERTKGLSETSDERAERVEAAMSAGVALVRQLQEKHGKLLRNKSFTFQEAAQALTTAVNGFRLRPIAANKLPAQVLRKTAEALAGGPALSKGQNANPKRHKRASAHLGRSA
jgi:hypothetical protein